MKRIAIATAAALLALSQQLFAQNSGSPSGSNPSTGSIIGGTPAPSPALGGTASGGDSTTTSSRCGLLVGEDRERCLRDQRTMPGGVTTPLPNVTTPGTMSPTPGVGPSVPSVGSSGPGSTGMGSSAGSSTGGGSLGSSGTTK